MQDVWRIDYTRGDRRRKLRKILRQRSPPEMIADPAATILAPWHAWDGGIPMMIGSLEGPLSDLTSWDALDAPGRRRIAEAVTGQLDDGFRLARVRTSPSGTTAHEVAIFALGDDRFVLLPGCRATLGYDRDSPFVPSPEQAEDWKKTEKEIGLSLCEYLDYCLTPLRCVVIGPLLMEVTAPALRLWAGWGGPEGRSRSCPGGVRGRVPAADGR